MNTTGADARRLSCQTLVATLTAVGASARMRRMDEPSPIYEPPPKIAEAMASVRTKKQLAELFRFLRLRAKKRFGQNFLVDHNLLSFMVRSAHVGPRDLVVDMGCGTGLLTRHLSEAAARVVGMELDRGLMAICSRYLEDCANVTLLSGDVLESKHRLSAELLDAVRREWETGRYAALRVVANLPYSIASLVVPNLLESGLPIAMMVVTVQKEVADRMAATPDCSDYGSMSVVIQAQAAVHILRRVPPEVFWPRPQVVSAIVRLTPEGERRAAIADFGVFKSVVRGAFLHRRKRMANALAVAGLDIEHPELASQIAASGIDPSARADHVGLAQYIDLANRLAARRK